MNTATLTRFASRTRKTEATSLNAKSIAHDLWFVVKATAVVSAIVMWQASSFIN
ncbi:hypothetical protein [Vibrio viridaestus]|uniref:hypothetical protein n=1 Tax=Vibrio viridaestus TaxID=2487322 RepID=UPI00140BA24A|nr:hypothetical protein [Vibrio viridaestus]